MLPAEFVGLGNVGRREPWPFEIGFQVILQAKEHGIGEHAAARFQIGIDPGRFRRILLPMREFVAIGSQQEVHGWFPPPLAGMIKSSPPLESVAGMRRREKSLAADTCGRGSTAAFLCPGGICGRDYSSPILRRTTCIPKM